MTDGEKIIGILREIQADTGQILATLTDHSQQFIGLRQDLHVLRGDRLRGGAMQARMNMRLARIETQLDTRNT